MNIFSDDTNRESGTKQHWWIFPDTFPPDTDRGMDVITSQSHYKQFMISERWARDRDTVETYASLVFLFIFSQSPSSPLFPRRARHDRAIVSRECRTNGGGVRVASVVTQWARDRIAKWRKEGSCVHAYLSNARLWKRPRHISRQYFRVALFKTSKENRATFVAMKISTQCLFLQRNWNEVSMERSG